MDSENFIIPDSRVSKSQAIDILTKMRAEIEESEENLPMIDTLTAAITDLGRCPTCYGRGHIVLPGKPPRNYTVKHHMGKTQYLSECPLCRSSGKVLSGKCLSCGKSYDVMPYQRHIVYCEDCEMSLIRSGKLEE